MDLLVLPGKCHAQIFCESGYEGLNASTGWCAWCSPGPRLCSMTDDDFWCVYVWLALSDYGPTCKQMLDAAGAASPPSCGADVDGSAMCMTRHCGSGRARELSRAGCWRARKPACAPRRLRGAGPGASPLMLQCATSIPLGNVPSDLGVWVDPQRGALCALHAVNSALQHAVLTENSTAAMRAALPAAVQPGTAGNYELLEVFAMLQTVAPDLRLHEPGLVHLGTSTDDTWADTLARSPVPLHNCDCALLTLLPADFQSQSEAALAALVTHHVAAIKVADAWFMLDSRSPDRAYPLGDVTVAGAFNAYVSFFGASQHAAAMPRAAVMRSLPDGLRCEGSDDEVLITREGVDTVGPLLAPVPRAPDGVAPSGQLKSPSHGSGPLLGSAPLPLHRDPDASAPGAAIWAEQPARPPAWVGAPMCSSEATAPGAFHVLLFLAERFVHKGQVARGELLDACDAAGLQAVRFADYAVERVDAAVARTRAAAVRAPHAARRTPPVTYVYRLTISDPQHAAQIRANPAAFKQAVRGALSCNAVVLASTRPAIASLVMRAATNTYVDRHGLPLRRRTYGERRPTAPPHSARGRAEIARMSGGAFAALESDCEAPHAAGHDPDAEGPASAARQSPAHPSAAVLDRQAARKRGARRGLRGDRRMYVGTFNVFDLGSADGAARLAVVEQMMTERGVKVLAVQESKLLDARQGLAMTSLRYFGQPACVQEGRRTGGTGFLVAPAAEPMVSFYGRRPAREHTSVTSKHAAEWMRILGASAAEDVWMASVYLPDASRPRAEFTAALSDLRADVRYYQQRAGSVLLAGDFNARVGHARCAGVPGDLRAAAPSHGESVCNWQGQQLLRFCLEHGLCFKSGAYEGSWGPTYVRRNGASGAVCGESVVDHVISSAQPESDCSPAPCFALHGEAGDVEFSQLFDHRPVLMHCPMGKHFSSRRRHVLIRWRTELLRDPTTERAYHQAVAANLHSSELPALADAITKGDQRGVDRASVAALAVFADAANRVLGTRTIVHGISKEWNTPEEQAARWQRREAYRQWMAAPTAAHAATLLQATTTVQQASRSARTQLRAKAATSCARMWRENPNSRATHQAVKRLSRSSQPAGVATLKHPTTGQDCATAEDQARAFAAHLAPIFESVPPTGDARRRLHRDNTAAVRAARRSDAPGPEQLECALSEEEVRRGLGALAAHKAPGDDNLPAELLKNSGPAGVETLHKLFNVVYAAERAPETWRKGTIVNLYKRDDPTDCGNYRPITLLRSMDKLYALLLTKRLQAHVPLHDQQYAFRPSRGTHNALFNVTSVLRTRVPAGDPTYACFFDARKAYDTVPREALLARLITKGVTGRMFQAIDQLYAQAENVVRVDSVTSQRFPVARGVAQGCPMSPFLYAVFIDSVLDDLYAQCSADGIPVGGSEWARMFVAQLYADDLACFATSAAGLQRMLEVVRAHSLRWGWEVNTSKTVSIVFGDAAARTAAAGTEFSWGTEALRLHEEAKYLGLRFRSDASWKDQEDAVVKQCLAAFYSWAPALASRQLPVRLKRDIIRTRIVPVATYSMEMWQPRTGRLGAAARIDSALHKARRLAVGVHATAGERSWECGACVSAAVLQADFQALDVQGYCDAAHLRYAEAARVADRAAARQRTHDPRASEFERELPAGPAPDFMGAAIRSGLPAADSWRQRVQRVRNVVLGEARADPGTSDDFICNADVSAGLLRAAAGARLASSAAAPSHRARSRAGRPLRPLAHTSPHFNPVQTVLAPDAPPPGYDCATPAAARIVAALRSTHVPGDHDGVFANSTTAGTAWNARQRCGASPRTSWRWSVVGVWCSTICCIVTVAWMRTSGRP